MSEKRARTTDRSRNLRTAALYFGAGFAVMVLLLLVAALVGGDALMLLAFGGLIGVAVQIGVVTLLVQRGRIEVVNR